MDSSLYRREEKLKADKTDQTGCAPVNGGTIHKGGELAQPLPEGLADRRKAEDDVHVALHFLQVWREVREVGAVCPRNSAGSQENSVESATDLCILHTSDGCRHDQVWQSS